MIPNSLKFPWEWFVASENWTYTQLMLVALAALIFFKVAVMIMAGPVPSDVKQGFTKENNSWRLVSKIFTGLLVFVIMLVVAWGGWQGYNTWQQTSQAKALLSGAQSLKIPEDPSEKKVVFSTKLNKQWADTTVAATPAQQIILQQLWETIHGQRASRFPLSGDGRNNEGYDPRQDPSASPTRPKDMSDPGTARRNPGAILD